MDEEIDIKGILEELWNRKVVIIVITVIFAFVGFLYGNLKVDLPSLFDGYKDVYTASNEFKLGDKKIINEEDSSIIISSIDVNDATIAMYSEILHSLDTLNIINDKYDLNISSSNWKSIVSISQVSESKVLSIKVKYTDGDIAKEIVDDLTEIIYNYNVETNSSYDVEPTTIISSTDVSKSSVSSLTTSTIIKYTALFAVLGFIIVCVIVVIIFIFSETIYDIEPIEEKLGIKNLTTISKNNNDAIKILRVNLDSCNQILFTTPTGKTKENVGIEIAKSFTELGKKVLYIDFKNENLNLIKKYNGKGLIDYLNSNDKFVEKYANETIINNLSILTFGNQYKNATELIESKEMVESLETLERIFDIVIISTADALNSVNTLAMTKIAKYTILSIQGKKDVTHDVVKAKKNIEDIGGNVIGTVFIK